MVSLVRVHIKLQSQMVTDTEKILCITTDTSLLWGSNTIAATCHRSRLPPQHHGQRSDRQLMNQHQRSVRQLMNQH